MPMTAARFRTLLLAWFTEARRPLGWRATHDPYAILVSEIMLQQTQAARVEPAWRAFLARFPTVAELARAPTAAVVAAWEGLGYNRRAVNLHRSARRIVAVHDGRVPDDLAALCALPGVGAYTARAVLAFAFGHAAAPVDTNVARVLTRAVAGQPLTRAPAQALADSLVPPARPAEWSSALMDLGARVCTARSPRCDRCPVVRACAWQERGGPDPAAASAGRPRPQGRFVGSNRYHRGRLVGALRAGTVAGDELGAAAGLDDPQGARRLADGLVADGLAEWDGERLRLPEA